MLRGSLQLNLDVLCITVLNSGLFTFIRIELLFQLLSQLLDYLLRLLNSDLSLTTTDLRCGGPNTVYFDLELWPGNSFTSPSHGRDRPVDVDLEFIVTWHQIFKILYW